MHDAPNLSAARREDHLPTRACGGRQRSSPTGGVAYGMPRYARTPGRDAGIPVMRPVLISTRVPGRTDCPVAVAPGPPAHAEARWRASHTPIGTQAKPDDVRITRCDLGVGGGTSPSSAGEARRVVGAAAA